MNKDIVNRDAAIAALNYLLEQTGPFISGLDTEEIAEMYFNALKKLN